MISHQKETLIRTRTHCMNLYSHVKAVQSLDVNGVIIDVSPAWLEITGFARDDVTGRHFIEFLHTDSHSCVKKNFPRLKDFGYVDNVQLQIKTQDNSALPCSLTGTSMYDANGVFRRTFCEITFNSHPGDVFPDDIDDFLDEMDDYLDRLGRFLNRKVIFMHKLLKGTFHSKA